MKVKVRMKTNLAHPTLGAIWAGDVVEMDEAEAQPFLSGGHNNSGQYADGRHTPAAVLVDPSTPCTRP